MAATRKIYVYKVNNYDSASVLTKNMNEDEKTSTTSL